MTVGEDDRDQPVIRTFVIAQDGVSFDSTDLPDKMMMVRHLERWCAF